MDGDIAFPLPPVLKFAGVRGVTLFRAGFCGKGFFGVEGRSPGRRSKGSVSAIVF